MRKRKTNSDYIKQADDILLKGVSSDNIALKFSFSDPFLRAFMFLMSTMNLDISDMDESGYMNSRNKLAYISAAQGVRSYAFYLEDEWRKISMPPFIIKDRTGKYYVIKKAAIGYMKYDTETGVCSRLVKSDMELFEYEDEAIAIMPTTAEEGIKFHKIAVQGFKPVKEDTLLFFVFALLSAITSAAVPIGINVVVGSFIPNESKQDIAVLCFGLICVILVGLCLNIVANRFRARIQVRWQSDFFLRFCDRMLKMPSGTMRKLAYELPGDTLKLVGALGNMISSVLSIGIYVLQLAVSVIQMGMYSTNVSITAVTLPFTVYILICILFLVLRYKKTKVSIVLQSRLMAGRQEIFDGIENIKGNANNGLFYYRYADMYDRYLRYNRKLTRYSQYITSLATIIVNVVTLTAYVSVAETGSGNVADLMAYISALSITVGNVGNVFNELSTIIAAFPVLRKIKPIMETPTERIDYKEETGEIQGRVSVNHVSFRYEGMSKDVIKDVTIDIRAGEHVGIVGSSGCGKSTLLRLMLGFETPQKGMINYDFYDMATSDKKFIRSQLGVVLQDAQLITGSIKRNIGFSENPDMKLVTEAARKADILEDIEKMPMKFETIVSDESAIISGGQKQRIVIARAIMHRPKVLFLDEATSALDNASQDRVMNAIDGLEATCVIIAHRLSTIQKCDRIIVLDDGKVAEEGSFEELMEMNGKFASMARRNML